MVLRRRDDGGSAEPDAAERAHPEVHLAPITSLPEAVMSTSNSRIEQMFPTLAAHQMATARRFASADARKFEAGEIVYDFGEKANPIWIVLEGSLQVYRHDGPSSEVVIVVHKPGQ